MRWYEYKMEVDDVHAPDDLKEKLLALTPKEFELLKTLIGSPGKALTRDYLIDTIWGQESTGRTLDVHIRTLRAKLGKYGSYIKTVRNVGYRLDKDE